MTMQKCPKCGNDTCTTLIKFGGCPDCADIHIAELEESLEATHLKGWDGFHKIKELEAENERLKGCVDSYITSPDSYFDRGEKIKELEAENERLKGAFVCIKHTVFDKTCYTCWETKGYIQGVAEANKKSV